MEEYKPYEIELRNSFCNEQYLHFCRTIYMLCVYVFIQYFVQISRDSEYFPLLYVTNEDHNGQHANPVM